MKLRNLLIIRTVALAALIFGLFGAILIQYSFHLQLTQERNSLEARSVYLAQGVEAAAVNYVLQNIPLTDDLLADILAQLDAGAALQSAPSFPEGISHAENELHIARGVRLSGREYSLLLSADLSPLYQSRRNLLLLYALLYLLTMLLFSLVMTLTAKSLTHPLEQLARISTRLSDGKLHVRAQPGDTLETALLSCSFNQMADSLTGQIERQQRFIADLTHEMKTPLTAIIGHADLIRSGRVTGDDAFLAAHSIFKEGRRLNSLSARLIQLILLEQDPPEMQLSSLRPLIEETIDALQPAAAELGIQLSLICPDVTIRCDRSLFSSLLSNLIDNALKSGAKNVSVETALTSELMSLRIIDDGRGMDRESLSKITDPFYRVDKSRSRSQGGAGLGLALCARIAQVHHAVLSFESAPGAGTAVTLSMLRKEENLCEE